jgi:hypothetical protein
MQTKLTHPKVIKDRSSVNCNTSSSSSIVQVSLVECCFGIRSVVTANLFPLSFPSNNPQVSRFRAVLSDAIDRNRGRHSRGKLTVFRSGTRTGSLALRVIRADSWEAVRYRSPST